MLPVNFLRQLIGLYGGKMQSAVPQYLDAAMDMFQKNQAAMRDAVGGAMGGAKSGTGGGAVGGVPFGGANMFADLAKRNMAMFEEAGRAFVPGAASAKKAGSETESQSEVETLRAELAALQAKVDRLGK